RLRLRPPRHAGALPRMWGGAGDGVANGMIFTHAALALQPRDGSVAGAVPHRPCRDDLARAAPPAPAIPGGMEDPVARIRRRLQGARRPVVAERALAGRRAADGSERAI